MSSVHVPVDDRCQMPGTPIVFIDDDGVVFDASLNQTNAGNNNNKFYRIQLLQDKSKGSFQTWTRWGRVGENGQSKLLGDGTLDHAMLEFKKKFKDKSKLRWDNRTDPPVPKAYVFIERSYEPDDDDNDDSRQATGGAAKEEITVSAAVSKLDQSVQNLMGLMFNLDYMNNVMVQLNYNANKLPLGKLSKRTLQQAFQTLKVRHSQPGDKINGGSLFASTSLAVEDNLICRRTQLQQFLSSFSVVSQYFLSSFSVFRR